MVPDPMDTPATLSPGGRRAKMGWGLSRVGKKVFWTCTLALKEWVQGRRLGREAEREMRKAQTKRDKEGEGEREK